MKRRAVALPPPINNAAAEAAEKALLDAAVADAAKMMRSLVKAMEDGMMTPARALRLIRHYCEGQNRYLSELGSSNPLRGRGPGGLRVGYGAGENDGDMDDDYAPRMGLIHGGQGEMIRQLVGVAENQNAVNKDGKEERKIRDLTASIANAKNAGEDALVATLRARLDAVLTEPGPPVVAEVGVDVGAVALDADDPAAVPKVEVLHACHADDVGPELIPQAELPWGDLLGEDLNPR